MSLFQLLVNLYLVISFKSLSIKELLTKLQVCLFICLFIFLVEVVVHTKLVCTSKKIKKQNIPKHCWFDLRSIYKTSTICSRQYRKQPNWLLHSSHDKHVGIQKQFLHQPAPTYPAVGRNNDSFIGLRIQSTTIAESLFNKIDFT